jgi:hypothetical protein
MSKETWSTYFNMCHCDRKGGSMNPTTDTLPNHRPCQLCFADQSLNRQTLIPPLDPNRLVALLLICLYSEDRQTYQHITQHNTPYNVFSHKCIPVLCILFISYIQAPTTQTCPISATTHKNPESDRSPNSSSYSISSILL